MHLHVSGETSYGRLRVHGIGSLTTRFFHLYYFPLVPVSGRLVVRGEVGPDRTIRVPISWKSVLLTWGRAASFIIACAGGLRITADVCQHPESLHGNRFAIDVALTAGSAIVLGYLLFSRAMRHASYAHAQKTRQADWLKRARAGEAGSGVCDVRALWV